MKMLCENQNPRYTLAIQPDRTSRAARALEARKGEREFFLFVSPQPFDMSRVARIEPSKSKQFYLDQLGLAWDCSAAAPTPAAGDSRLLVVADLSRSASRPTLDRARAWQKATWKRTPRRTA